MRVRNIMSTPVISMPSNTPVLEAAQLMKEKRIERLPVVDNDQLVGLVTKDRVLRASPSMATSLSLHEIHYLFAKLTLKEIMQRDIVTVDPETTVEKAVRLAQQKRVGCLPVVEDGRLVGIVTTNDFFYLVLNPLLGLGEEKGATVKVRRCATAQMVTALQCVVENKLEVLNAAYLPSRRGGERDLILHLNGTSQELVCSMQKRGLEAELQEP
jgi:acetoin utilization protein AcuB